MSTRIAITWALIATAVAIGALGYILGKQAGTASADTQWLPADSQPATDASNTAGAPQAVYTVPEQFAEVPHEWHTDDAKALEGYAALFAPARREVIIEHCKHEGYKPDSNGRFSMPNKSFCETVLWVTLASITDDKAVGVDRSGQNVVVRVGLDSEDDVPVLRLRFDGHDARMTPGSKNDLLQAMEQHPEIAEQKKRFMMAMMNGDRERVADQATAPTAERP